MYKRDRKVRLKEIINALSELVVTLNDQVTPLMEEVEKRLSSLAELLEANFIIQQYPNIDFTQIWHKAIYMRAELREYYIAALRRGESLTGEPRITINTIHSVKGGECDNVVLLTDISPRTYEEAIKDYDNECRVFYVGVTRAIQNLFIIEPYQDFNFEI